MTGYRIVREGPTVSRLSDLYRQAKANQQLLLCFAISKALNDLYLTVGEYENLMEAYNKAYPLG